MTPEVTRAATAGDGTATVGVVIPYHGRVDLLERCLDAVCRLDPAPTDVVVVGDGDAIELEPARRSRVRLLSTVDRRGPAAARNTGAAALATDIVLFIDADVVVPTDTVARVQRTLAARPDVDAVFGSYDDHPPAPGVVSRYKNLLHHWTHQHARDDASTFWTGCGAIRRSVFLDMGGFDPDQRWLEDVELGYRLHAAGRRVVLDRDLQVTHLKRWTLVGLVTSDVFHRALPWTELANRYRSLPRDLNTDLRGRVSGGLAVIAACSVPALVLSPRFVLLIAAAVLGLVVINAGLYRFLGRRGGVAVLLCGTALHWSYLLYGSAAFAVGSLWWGMTGTRRPTARASLADASGTAPGGAQGAPAAASESVAGSPRAARRSA